jgi:hypothetical protein
MSPGKSYGHAEAAYCLRFYVQVKMKAAIPSKTSVSMYKKAQCHFPKGVRLLNALKKLGSKPKTWKTIQNGESRRRGISYTK